MKKEKIGKIIMTFLIKLTRMRQVGKPVSATLWRISLGLRTLTASHMFRLSPCVLPSAGEKIKGTSNYCLSKRTDIEPFGYAQVKLRRPRSSGVRQMPCDVPQKTRGSLRLRSDRAHRNELLEVPIRDKFCMCYFASLFAILISPMKILV